MIRCSLCNEIIVKYMLDLGNTVQLNINNDWKCICEECSHNISLQRISR